MSQNLAFFSACWQEEIPATVALIRSLPTDQLDYRAHPVNRSARQLVEHLLAHAIDLGVIACASVCEETLTAPVTTSAEAADQYAALCAKVTAALADCTAAQWETEPVELRIKGEPFVTLPRMNMMWFFFFDIIHHRGQLSTHVRPMGGSVPAIYGFSFDSGSPV